jgi:hypothetical protein
VRSEGSREDEIGRLRGPPGHCRLLVRYATAVDQRDWKLLRSCFTDDCGADYGDIGRWSSGDEITAWMRTTHDPLGHSLHRISNQTVASSGTVTARSYVDVIVLGPDNIRGARAAGYYDDVVVHTDDGWKIGRRRALHDGHTGVAPTVGRKGVGPYRPSWLRRRAWPRSVWRGCTADRSTAGARSPGFARAWSARAFGWSPP